MVAQVLVVFRHAALAAPLGAGHDQEAVEQVPPPQAALDPVVLRAAVEVGVLPVPRVVAVQELLMEVLALADNVAHDRGGDQGDVEHGVELGVITESKVNVPAIEITLVPGLSNHDQSLVIVLQKGRVLRESEAGGQSEGQGEKQEQRCQSHGREERVGDDTGIEVTHVDDPRATEICVDGL